MSMKHLFIITFLTVLPTISRAMQKEASPKKNPLHRAAQSGRSEACKALIRAGHDVFAEDAEGHLPLTHDTLQHYSIFLTTAPSIVPVLTTIMAMQKYRKDSLWGPVPPDVIKDHLIPYILFNAIETQLARATKLLATKQPYATGKDTPHRAHKKICYLPLKEAAETLRRSTDSYPALDPEKVAQYRNAIATNIRSPFTQ